MQDRSPERVLMPFDPPRLRGMTARERQRAVTRLALLPTGTVEAEQSDDGR